MNINNESERRRYTRVKFDTAATVAQGDNVYHSHILDISLNGVLLEAPKEYVIRAESPANISIFLSDSAEIQMKVTLAHTSNEHIGFHCKSIDVESAGHLRRLIELNLDDPNAPERVLEELLLLH